MKQIKTFLIKLQIFKRNFIIMYINPVMVDCIIDITKQFNPKSKRSLIPIPVKIINDPFIASSIKSFEYYKNFTKL